MTAASPQSAIASGDSVPAPEGWRELRNDPDIQFEEFAMAPEEMREPGWLDEVWNAIGEALATLLGPVGEFLANNWNMIKWVLLGLLAAFVLYWLLRSFGPLARMRGEEKAASGQAKSDPDWQPTKEESVALLADADRLAAEGRFDEATHLLLKRSVSQIASAQPTWVDPSSTARELAALPALSDRAAQAFGTIAERVERSLFALRPLDQKDWEAAREAYASFAQISLRPSEGAKA
ncbi:hypothetical protein INR77_15510 [Erythrobacter sp. SCSIO 43205]|uniref:hypothetical protein n=1 Tax=Erythrobacter sp. SCSIO 43205 TaxID=2779361 RepID=UPI001CA8FB2B|nr:hypothetical protein [Erythrobacter sp. SCSIO 43205]UAB78129.1 hypothetical protein INR77_15510 [Erythrobacter sp. SCSIO 43205]